MKSKNTTCPSPISTIVAHPLSIGITLHRLLLYIAIACTVLTLIGTVWLVVRHLRRYTAPDEQRQLIRLVCTPLVYGVFAVLALADYGGAEYFEPIPDLYEAFGLGCLFVLFVEYMRPVGGVGGTGKESLESEGGTMDRSYLLIFQYPLVKLILTIAQLASTATGTYCAASNSAHYGHIWIVVLGDISLTVCFLAILAFYRTHATAPAMLPHKPLLKIVGFKLIVAVELVRNLVFNFIDIPTGLRDNGTLSPRDIKFGIPMCIVCGEMMLFTAFFHYAFRSQPYKPFANGNGAGMPLGRAALDAVDLRDWIGFLGRWFRVVMSGEVGRMMRERKGKGKGRVGGGKSGRRSDFSESSALRDVESVDSSTLAPSRGPSPVPVVHVRGQKEVARPQPQAWGYDQRPPGYGQGLQPPAR